jgi:hypothetical protein
MRADKGQFDEVLRRMIQKNPKKTTELHKRGGYQRRKNPETDPAYMSPLQPASPEVVAEVERQKKEMAEREKKKR